MPRAAPAPPYRGATSGDVVPHRPGMVNRTAGVARSCHRWRKALKWPPGNYSVTDDPDGQVGDERRKPEGAARHGAAESGQCPALDRPDLFVHLRAAGELPLPLGRIRDDRADGRRQTAVARVFDRLAQLA